MLTERELRYLVRSKLRIMQESAKKPVAGSQPDQRYVPATKKNMFLDRPMQIGGWPEGEYDPPIQDRLSDYFKDMGLMTEGELETFLHLVLQ